MTTTAAPSSKAYPTTPPGETGWTRGHWAATCLCAAVLAVATRLCVQLTGALGHSTRPAIAAVLARAGSNDLGGGVWRKFTAPADRTPAQIVMTVEHIGRAEPAAVDITYPSDYVLQHPDAFITAMRLDAAQAAQDGCHGTTRACRVLTGERISGGFDFLADSEHGYGSMVALAWVCTVAGWIFLILAFGFWPRTARNSMLGMACFGAVAGGACGWVGLVALTAASI